MSNKSKRLPEENKIDISRARAVWRLVRTRPRKCICPGCTETRIIDSHSLSQSYPLNAIAVDGWVYQPKFRDIGGILFRSFATGAIFPIIDKEETSKASVFNWYCNAHDNQLFKHIDVPELALNNEQQVRELYLRAMSRNIANLEDGARFVAELESIRRQVGISEVYTLSSSQLAYESDIRRLWNPFWESKLSGTVNWYWRVRQGNLGVSVSAMYPMAGEENAEDWFDDCAARPMVALSVIPQRSGVTHVVFAWWYEWDQMMRYFKDMLENSSDDAFLHVLNQIVVKEIDGYCISPKIWDKLTIFERRALEHFQQCDMCHNPMMSAPALISRRNVNFMKGN